MQEVDTDYAVVKPSADRASRKKIVEDEAEAKTAKGQTEIITLNVF